MATRKEVLHDFTTRLESAAQLTGNIPEEWGSEESSPYGTGVSEMVGVTPGLGLTNGDMATIRRIIGALAQLD